MSQPERYAPTEAEERRDLARLRFVGRKQAEFILDKRNPIEKVRAELHRVYPDDMARLDANCVGPSARPAPSFTEAIAAAERVIARAQVVIAQDAAQRTEQQAQVALDVAFGLAPSADRAATAAPATVQMFGASKALQPLPPVRAPRTPGEAGQARRLDQAFDPEASSNTQTFGASAR